MQQKVISRVALLLVAVAVALVSWDLAQVSAQTVSSPTTSSSSTVQSALQSLGVTSSQSTAGIPPPAAPVIVQPSVTPYSQNIAPAVPPTAAQLPTSTLELLYSQRAGQPLQQFGYDIFGMGSPVTVSQIGNVQDQYILGPGDQLTIVCRGHDNNTYVVPVDRDGRVIVPGYEPVQAAGRTFGQVRHDLQAVIAKDALSTQAFVSLAQTRQISVLVSGEVNAPGVRTLSGLNTPIDALLLSGGVRKTGSLRNIVLVRGGRHIRIDLYSVLADGRITEVGNLTDGDRIEVPAIGSTVAAVGLVNRPAIYELPSNTRGITTEALVRLAGGSLAGANHLSKLVLESDGSTRLVALARSGIVQSGEILSVDQEAGNTFGRVTLAGAVALPGTRPLDEVPTMSKLLRQPGDLAQGAYTPLGILVHVEPHTNFHRAVAFSVARVLAGQEDLKLSDGDLVFVMSRPQAQALAVAAAGQLQAQAQAASVPPSEVTMALSASAAQATAQPAVSTVPGTTSAPPVNNAASIYMASNGAAPVSATTSAAPAASTGTAPGAPAAPTTVGGAVATGLGQAVTGTFPVGSAPIGATTVSPVAPSAPAGLMTSAPLPPVPPYQASVAAAASQQSPAAIAMLQAENAQSAAAGMPLSGGGLTKPPALGVPAPDTSPTDLAAELGLTTNAFINFAVDYLVFVEGNVHDPGPYLAEGGSSLATALDAAGGLNLTADLSAITVTSSVIDTASGASRTVRNQYRGNSMADFEKVALQPQDTIIVRQVYSDRESGTVMVVGAVRYPGTFDILRDEHLSSLLGRAGGLTDEAYPLGAVFTRLSAQQAEAQGNYREAIELQTGALTAATTPNVNPSLLTYLQTLEQQLLKQPALGRITVTADPTILAVKPELDTLLQPGDFIYVPKRPSTVAVSGEVLNPGSFQYRPGMSVDDYVDQAGGYSKVAEDDETFIILPDGSARTPSSNILSFFGSDPIPPGSTIVVPPNPAPFNTMVFLTQVSQIFGQVAIAAAGLSAVSHNNS
ncbi:MAG TPA: SLBB domain-containing protein [Rhizomicrobium sp.]|jgi:protein involved in polysaccharide export with SLBB domain|nr:SLBB domain-containing protein [Rhizomicrobium sp.]